MNMVKKMLRYFVMYGIRRTFAKVLYKFDTNAAYFLLRLLYMSGRKSDKRIVFVGMGNHGFTLLAFFVSVVGKQRVSSVIDPSEKSRKIALKVLGCPHFPDIESAQADGEFYGDIIYIASDHASHTKHAIVANDFFGRVYVEKPLFVNSHQLGEFRALIENDCNLHTGFNRPHAPFFVEFTDVLSDDFNVTMVINGHHLPKEHWYRNDGQGSRVLGNLTHWIDLSLRIFLKNTGTTSLDIQLSKGHLDDLVVVFSSEARKISLSFSANCEPSDGVEEFIFWNCSKSVGKIMNFRELSYITNDGVVRKTTKANKNVGHGLASLAPLYEVYEDSRLSFMSSALALKVEDMYLTGSEYANFSLKL